MRSWTLVETDRLAEWSSSSHSSNRRRKRRRRESLHPPTGGHHQPCCASRKVRTPVWMLWFPVVTVSYHNDRSEWAEPPEDMSDAVSRPGWPTQLQSSHHAGWGGDPFSHLSGLECGDVVAHRMVVWPIKSLSGVSDYGVHLRKWKQSLWWRHTIDESFMTSLSCLANRCHRLTVRVTCGLSWLSARCVGTTNVERVSSCSAVSCFWYFAFPIGKWVMLDLWW